MDLTSNYKLQASHFPLVSIEMRSRKQKLGARHDHEGIVLLKAFMKAHLKSLKSLLNASIGAPIKETISMIFQANLQDFEKSRDC